jgi:hypothetical protein
MCNTTLNFFENFVKLIDGIFVMKYDGDIEWR